jgi:uncharacterized UPF0146 family protein
MNSRTKAIYALRPKTELNRTIQIFVTCVIGQAAVQNVLSGDNYNYTLMTIKNAH